MVGGYVSTDVIIVETGEGLGAIAGGSVAGDLKSKRNTSDVAVRA
jgi:hypothetical protein